MTNELRIKIAESLGWHDCYETPSEPMGFYDTEGVSRTLPDFTDANAALQLVEVLKKEGWLSRHFTLSDGWHWTFHDPTTVHSVFKPTLPEAVCLAYCAVKSIPI